VIYRSKERAMGDEEQYDADTEQSGDLGVADAIDNATSEELAADDPRRDETEGAAENPTIVLTREEGTTAPKLS
jgi:hypothetical protein